MSKSEKQMEKENARNQKIIDTAFQIFVERKIEPVSMGEIADAVGIGRATLFRCYANKTELVIAVCAAKWKAYLDKLDEIRPLSSIGNIPAIDRFIFTLDSYIWMYQNYKELLLYNDNFNHYVTHEGVDKEKLKEFTMVIRKSITYIVVLSSSTLMVQRSITRHLSRNLK